MPLTKSASEMNQIAVLEKEVQGKLTNEFGLDKNKEVYNLMVKYSGELENLEKLKTAISKVEEALDRKEIERNPDAIFVALISHISQLNSKVGYSNQLLVTQANERSNSVNTIGSLVNTVLPSHKMEIESAEEEKIRKEKTGIWQELIGRFDVDDEKAHDFVEEYCVEALNYSISKVVEALKKHKIPQDPAIIAEELRKYASLWKP